MMNMLYSIIVFPIEQLISLAYVFAYRVFDNPALSVLGVSFAVSIFTLPLYFMAESIQRAERDIQQSMKPMVDNIRAVFSGDERFMRLAAYYRQNNYHPLYSLRSSISILIQIPFFIAAYHFLSNAAMLTNVSFGPITDLAKPDSLITIHGATINVLPIIMTLVNFAASAIYVKGFSAREKLQLYGMAAIFLVLLYNSPSALVLYWTGNNVFSLVKNVIQKTKHPKAITLALVSVVCLLFIEYVAFFHDGNIIKRLFIAHFAALVPVSLYVAAFAAKKRQCAPAVPPNPNTGNIFVLASCVLFLLAGFVIPSSLIRTSVAEFSFVEHIESPFHFLTTVLLQSAGFFLLWPICIYAMASRKVRKLLGSVFVVIAFVAMANAFLFPGNYGFLTEQFTFSEMETPGSALVSGNLLLLFIIFASALLILKRFKKLISAILTVSVTALIFAGLFNSFRIFKEFQLLHLPPEDNKIAAIEPTYEFSKTGKNVIVILLDRAMAAYVPYIFDEKPELLNSFDGFTFYKNTVSFGSMTLYGSAPIFGGYEYTPLEMQTKNTMSIAEKRNESLLLLPRIFLDHKFGVSVTDPVYANNQIIPDLSIFSSYPEINVKHLEGVYTDEWLKQNDNYELNSNTTRIIKNRLIRFAFFKFMPLMLRNFMYDEGNWLIPKATGYTGISEKTLDAYVLLDILPLITKIDDEAENKYNAIYSNLPHEPAFLQAPDYTLSINSTDLGPGRFANDPDYHVNMASLLLLKKWFTFLKENGVYDNSRIIIVGDHATGYTNGEDTDNVTLPDSRPVQLYNPLFFVKDFNAHGALVTDNSFMTNADIPIIALKDLVENPANPFTGKAIASDKENGVTITTSREWDPRLHPENTFNIKPDEWMHVHDNIFDSKNWSMVTIPE